MLESYASDAAQAGTVARRALTVQEDFAPVALPAGDELLRIGRHGAQKPRACARVRDPAMRHVVRAFVWPHDVPWGRRGWHSAQRRGETCRVGRAATDITVCSLMRLPTAIDRPLRGTSHAFRHAPSGPPPTGAPPHCWARPSVSLANSRMGIVGTVAAFSLKACGLNGSVLPAMETCTCEESRTSLSGTEVYSSHATLVGESFVRS